MPGRTAGKPVPETRQLDASHPHVQALVAGGMDIKRLEQLVNHPSINHPAVSAPPIAQAPSMPSPQLDTADLQAEQAGPAAFNQMLQQTAADTQNPTPTPTPQPSDSGLTQLIQQLIGAA